MTWIDVDQFRSSFVGDLCTLTAQLSSPPHQAWRDCCGPNLERYESAFGQLPTLGHDTLFVPVNALDMAVAEAALGQVVGETNRRVFASEA
jgi:hypothetical protein